jgi:hypothetical protein
VNALVVPGVGRLAEELPPLLAHVISMGFTMTLEWVTEAVHASRVVVSLLAPSVAVDAAELPPSTEIRRTA